MNDFERGDIYYINNETVQGMKSRPGLIVSNNNLNEHSPVVKVVFLTSADKYDSPYHVHVKTDRDSIALCEGIYTIKKERLSHYITTCSFDEMRMIDKGLAYSIGLELDEKKDTEISDVEKERDIYKKLYEELLNKVIR